MTVLAQQSDILHKLSDAVDALLRSETEIDLTDRSAYLHVGGRYRTLGARIGSSVAAGVPDEDIMAIVEPARTVWAQSPFMRRAQEWARGYPGDFEVVEHIMAQANDAPVGTLDWHVEANLQNSAISQLHRNKVTHQARLISDLLTNYGGARSVLLIASGAAPDLRLIPPGIVRPGDRFVLNDVEPDALALAGKLLGPLNEFCTMVPGNVFRAVGRLAELGPYDLVLAGGLFDYLNDRAAKRLIDSVLSRLCRPGATFYFSNIATGNPYRWWMEYLMDWQLIERDEAAVRALVASAGDVSISYDPTGLTLFAHVHPGYA